MKAWKVIAFIGVCLPPFVSASPICIGRNAHIVELSARAPEPTVATAHHHVADKAVVSTDCIVPWDPRDTLATPLLPHSSTSLTVSTSSTSSTAAASSPDKPDHPYRHRTDRHTRTTFQSRHRVIRPPTVDAAAAALLVANGADPHPKKKYQLSDLFDWHKHTKPDEDSSSNSDDEMDKRTVEGLPSRHVHRQQYSPGEAIYPNVPAYIEYKPDYAPTIPPPPPPAPTSNQPRAIEEKKRSLDGPSTDDGLSHSSSTASTSDEHPIPDEPGRDTISLKRLLRSGLITRHVDTHDHDTGAGKSSDSSWERPDYPIDRPQNTSWCQDIPKKVWIEGKSHSEAEYENISCLRRRQTRRQLPPFRDGPGGFPSGSYLDLLKEYDRFRHIKESGPFVPTKAESFVDSDPVGAAPIGEPGAKIGQWREEGSWSEEALSCSDDEMAVAKRMIDRPQNDSVAIAMQGNRKRMMDRPQNDSVAIALQGDWKRMIDRPQNDSVAMSSSQLAKRHGEENLNRWLKHLFGIRHHSHDSDNSSSDEESDGNNDKNNGKPTVFEIRSADGPQNDNVGIASQGKAKWAAAGGEASRKDFWGRIKNALGGKESESSDDLTVDKLEVGDDGVEEGSFRYRGHLYWPTRLPEVKASKKRLRHKNGIVRRQIQDHEPLHPVQDPENLVPGSESYVAEHQKMLLEGIVVTFAQRLQKIVRQNNRFSQFQTVPWEYITEMRQDLVARSQDIPEFADALPKQVSKDEQPEQGSENELLKRDSKRGRHLSTHDTDGKTYMPPTCTTPECERKVLVELIEYIVPELDTIIAQMRDYQKGFSVFQDLENLRDSLVRKAQAVPRFGEFLERKLTVNMGQPVNPQHRPPKQRKRKVLTGHKVSAQPDHVVSRPIPNVKATDGWRTIVGNFWKRGVVALGGNADEEPVPTWQVYGLNPGPVLPNSIPDVNWTTKSHSGDKRRRQFEPLDILEPVEHERPKELEEAEELEEESAPTHAKPEKEHHLDFGLHAVTHPHRETGRPLTAAEKKKIAKEKEEKQMEKDKNDWSPPPLPPAGAVPSEWEYYYDHLEQYHGENHRPDNVSPTDLKLGAVASDEHDKSTDKRHVDSTTDTGREGPVKHLERSRDFVGEAAKELEIANDHLRLMPKVPEEPEPEHETVDLGIKRNEAIRTVTATRTSPTTLQTSKITRSSSSQVAPPTWLALAPHRKRVVRLAPDWEDVRFNMDTLKPVTHEKLIEQCQVPQPPTQRQKMDRAYTYWGALMIEWQIFMRNNSATVQDFRSLNKRVYEVNDKLLLAGIGPRWDQPISATSETAMPGSPTALAPKLTPMTIVTMVPVSGGFVIDVVMTSRTPLSSSTTEPSLASVSPAPVFTSVEGEISPTSSSSPGDWLV